MLSDDIFENGQMLCESAHLRYHTYLRVSHAAPHDPASSPSTSAQ